MQTSRQIPPQDIEAEMSVLGSVLVDNEALHSALDIIRPDDLYRQAHRNIFSAMVNLADRSEPIDLTTLSTELKSRKELEESGGTAYLAVLFDFVPMSANVAYYSRIVSDRARARRLITGGMEGIALAYDGESEQAIAKFESTIQPNASDNSSGPVGMDQCGRELIERLEERARNRGQVTGLTYGLSDLDEKTLGMHPGQLIIIAGRPSMGKTALALNITREVCRIGKRALIFTLEMDRGECIDRIVAAGNVKYQHIRSGRLEEMEQMRVYKVAERMKEWTLEIDDTPGVSLSQVRSRSKRAHRKGLDLLVIDYLQLMSLSDPKMSRVQGLGEVSRGLKQLARELGIPVILLSQLNRSVDSRTDKRPLMSDLRDSGEIEQDADVIIFPFRPAAYCEKCRDRVVDGDHDYRVHQAEAEIIIEKQRAGERNISVEVTWLGEYQRFQTVQKEYGGLPS